jgi:hypothetical protein
VARKKYFVSPTGNGDWKVTHRGDTLETFANKEDAIDFGRTIAKANEPSQLVIQKGDGSFETEYTYGDDPSPPLG